MAISSLSAVTSSNTTNKLRSTCTKLKQRILTKKTRAVIRHAKREPAQTAQELLSKTKETRMEVEDPSTATYLAKVREYKTSGRWAADRRKVGRPPYDEVFGF